MSDIAHIDVEYVARLARIALTSEEKERFSAQLDRVLEYFSKLNELDLDGVEPIAHANPLVNVWDKDEVRAAFTPDHALANAPAHRDQQIVVPKVVEDA